MSSLSREFKEGGLGTIQHWPLWQYCMEYWLVIPVISIIIIIKFVTNVKQYNTTVYDMCDRNKEQNFHPNYYLIPLLTMY